MSERSFCETRGVPVFDWFEQLTKPDSEINWFQLKVKAADWVTCACGNQCEIIPRQDKEGSITFGQPIDQKLRTLGVHFLTNVEDKDSQAALKTLEQIELRSAELINEINSKK